jgi:hypothetical protein
MVETAVQKVIKLLDRYQINILLEKGKGDSDKGTG